MRITKISLKNYRQYQQCEFVFPENSYDLHLLIGHNAQGKSNLLNAINWCLYNKEPHLTNEAMACPIVNLDTLNQSDDEAYYVEVEIELIDDDQVVRFKRKSTYLRSQINKNGPANFTKLSVLTQKENSNWTTCSDESAHEIVGYYFPHDIREIFFFDGEQLSAYFKESSNKRIKNTIALVSQIQILEVIEDRLEKLLTKKRREASHHSPDLDKLDREIEYVRKNIQDTEEMIGDLKDKLSKAKEEKDTIDEFLGQAPNIEDLNRQRQELNEAYEKHKKSRKAKENDFYNVLPEYITLLTLKQDMFDFQSHLQELQKAKQIPPTIERGLVERIIDEKKCAICESELNNENLEAVKKLLETIKISSELAKILNEQDKELYANLSRLESRGKEVENDLKDIQSHKDLEKQAKKQLDELDRKVSLIPNQDEIINAWKKRRDLASAIDQTNRDIGASETDLKSWNKQLNEQEEEQKRQIRRLGLAQTVKNEIDFCERALAITRKSKKELIDETREEVREKTKNRFLALNWVGENYSDVLLNENYELNVEHKTGYMGIGGLAGSERALLALSYILALHEITNLDSPLIIDTPIATIAGENRTNFASVLSKVSESKQVVLLLTPAEYSDELVTTFSGKFASRKKIVRTDLVSSVKEYLNG